MPDGRSGHTMTRVLTRFLLVCGGVNGENVYCDDLALFDLHTESWSLHAPSAPLKRIGHVAGYASGRLYVFGGADGAGKASSELHAFDCDALFPQTAALTFEQDPSRVMDVKASPSLNGLLDKFTVECWVWPRSFVPNAPALVKADGNLKVGFGLVALDEATARKYVALDKEKVREGGAKERNPWENSLAEAERLPTMAFFVNGLKRETSALIRVLPEEWSHVAATFDGKMLTTYCNGRRADYVVIDPPLEEYLHTQGDLCVGGTPGKAAWDGHLDAARVWNSCLSWETIRGADERHVAGAHAAEHDRPVGVQRGRGRGLLRLVAQVQPRLDRQPVGGRPAGGPRHVHARPHRAREDRVGAAYRRQLRAAAQVARRVREARRARGDRRRPRARRRVDPKDRAPPRPHQLTLSEHTATHVRRFRLREGRHVARK